MPRVLFIATHRLDRSPSQRFRYEQYLHFLQKNGYECVLSPLIREEEDRFFYTKGHYVRKAWVILKSSFIRLKDVLRVHEFDLVFIQREAFLTGSTLFERLFRWRGAKIVFDFDDAIWKLDVSDGNKHFKWLKRPAKTADIIALSDLVFAGNAYLRDYALPYNQNVLIIPTTIDAEEYQPKPALRSQITIGWSGSITTIKHFELALPFLKTIRKKYPQIQIKVIGDAAYTNTELGIQGLAWSKHNEIEELCSFDIGIMPLPDDEWAKGKCGLKGLQYMALGIPTIMSPVGVNTDIIQSGVNGFLATSDEEWVSVLSRLIEQEELRQNIGKQARKTVLEHYSVKRWEANYLEAFNTLLKK
jgi:glycosyltransferase involved in cell wall biosynthesis